MIDHDYLKYYGRIKRGDVILDLGASVGEFPMRYEHSIKSFADLYVAVEPSLWCLAILANWLNNNLGTKSMLISAAVWDKVGSEPLDIATSYLVNALKRHQQDISKYGCLFVRTDMVPTLTLDTILDIIGRQVNFLKCDIEGGEIALLKSEKLDSVDHFAIASYHDFDTWKTHELLQPHFESLGWEVVVEGIGTVDETMLYAWKEPR